MKAFCIPVSLADKLKRAAQAGDIKIQDLYEMTSEQRRAVFRKYTDTETASLINAGFEESIVSSQKNALKDWVKKTFTAEQKKTPEYRDVVRKIEELDSLGVIDPDNQENFLEDLVASKLGISVSKEEVEKLTKFAQELAALKPASDDSKFGISVEYLQKRREINNYMESLTPSSRAKVATSTIGRGVMLLSIKSPLLNIQSNTIGAFLEGLTKRISTLQFVGKNGDIVMEYTKFAMDVYRKTGFDITRMMEVQLSPKTLGEDIVTSQGTGNVRKLGRIVEDVVFKSTLGLPDVMFSGAQFADTANLASTLIAKKEGLHGAAQKERARAIMLDAMTLEPKTPEGAQVRNQAVADAAYATYQNDSLLSRISLNIRGLINQATGDLRLGDQLMPFVKTPANVISFGFDYSVGGVLKGAIDLKNARTAKNEGDVDLFKKHINSAIRNFVRSGLGLSIGLLVAAMIDDDEFIGAYPTNAKERELFKTQNGVANSIRIGDTYISLDYFGALSNPLMGYMYAKKYGNNVPGQATNFLYGGLNDLSKLPGYEAMRDIVEGINDRASQNQNLTIEEEVGGVINGITDFVMARVIPGGVNDLAKMVDGIQREVDYKDPVSKLISKIPFLSKNLDEKTDMFGNPLKQEQPISVLLFGSRVKTKNESEIIEELERLKNVSLLPSLSDIRKSSTRFIGLVAQLNNEEKAEEAYEYYQKQLGDIWSREIKSYSYQRLADEDKSDLLSTLRTDVLENTLKRYGYRKPRD